MPATKPKPKPLAVRRRVRRALPLEPVPEHRTDDTQHVNAVARALRILDAFRPGEGPLGNAELAERTGLTKPTVSRLAYTLVQAGYLSLNTRRLEYELGGAALALGAVAFSYRNLRDIARPLMRAFAAEGSFNIGLGTRDRHLMIYTDACEGRGLVALRLYAGSRMPILTSAMGRAYLAGLSSEEREAVLQELRPQYGAEWPTILKGVQTALRDVANRGFCLSAGDWQKDIHGLATPIRCVTDGRVFAINLGGPAYLLPVTEMTEVLGPRLVRVAKEIESNLTRTR